MRLKLRVLNQNPPLAALKLSPSNTRGFPVKRKAVCQTPLLGVERSTAAGTLQDTRNMNGFDSAHTHIHSYTKAHIRAAYTIC